MHFGNIKFLATEDGEGCRTVLFVSGCRKNCKFCFQPETHNFEYGQLFTEETEQIIIDSLKPAYVAGLTLLGGEPFEPENQKVLRPFVEKIKDIYPNKTIWAYSGRLFEEFINNNSPYNTPDTAPLLKNIDILVDGEFINEEKDITLPFRGSRNQRIIDVKQTLDQNNIVLSKFHYKNR